MVMGYITPSVLGGPQHFKVGDKNKIGPHVGGLATSPLPSGGLQSFTTGNKVESGPHVGGLGTLPLPFGWSPMLQGGGQNQKWPTCARNAYITPSVCGPPTLQILGDKNRSGPHVGGLATSPLPSWGSPKFHCEKQSRKWPACGRTGHITLAVWGAPTLQGGGENQKQHHPCRHGGPQHFGLGGRSGRPVEGLATSTLLSRGSPTLHTPAFSRIPRRGHKIKSGCRTHAFLRAHKWAELLRNPCDLRHP